MLNPFLIEMIPISPNMKKKGCIQKIKYIYFGNPQQIYATIILL